MPNTKTMSHVVLLSGILGLSACSSLQKGDTHMACEGHAQYQVTYESIWSEETFPIEYPPSDAHYSKLVGATHLPDIALWQEGQKASEAITLVAEKGQNHKLKNRVEWLIKVDKAGSYIDGPDLKTGTGIITTQFTATPEFSSLSLISMIAPSPDWFVGVPALPLCVNGAWINEYSAELYAFDGGTSSGDAYAYATSETATSPADKIKPVSNERLNIDKDKIFGVLTLTKQ